MSIALEKLAHERSSEKRRELLNSLTSMFLSGAENHTDREQALYAEVVLQVLDEITTKDRMDFSNSVADSEYMPGTIVRRLAHDEIAVASPVLTRSPVLTDEDLVEVARSATQDQLHAISNRESLSETVTDTLVERGNQKVVCAVTENPGARFSETGLTTLTRRSADDEEVRSRLLGRADLRDQLKEKILPMIGGDYANELLGMIDSVADETIDEVVDTVQSTVKSARSDDARRRLETRVIIKDIRDGSRNLDNVIVTLANQGRIMDIATVLSALVQLADNLVSNVMFKSDNEPVAIVLRAAGASEAGFKAIQELRSQKLRLPQSHLDRGMQTFAELDEQTARRSLRFVKVRTEVA